MHSKLYFHFKPDLLSFLATVSSTPVSFAPVPFEEVVLQLNRSYTPVPLSIRPSQNVQIMHFIREKQVNENSPPESADAAADDSEDSQPRCISSLSDFDIFAYLGSLICQSIKKYRSAILALELAE